MPSNPEKRWHGEWCAKHPDRMATGAAEGRPMCDECCRDFFFDDDAPEPWEPDFTVDPNDPTHPGWQP
jgi:hypothetical protein